MRLNRRAGITIAVGVWCLMTVVLANAYAGTLLSFLTVQKLQQPINSIEELAESKTCQLIVQGGSEWTKIFLVGQIIKSEPRKLLIYCSLSQDRMQRMGHLNWLAIH